MNSRTANAQELALMLQDARSRTLTLADAYAAALGKSLAVPQLDTLNPPLWELGHIAWFADHWLCNHANRGFASVAAYDALYDSSHVAHNTRWDLPLPTLAQTKARMQASLNEILARLAAEKSNSASNSDAALYFYRLALFHEDMHAEAAIYSAEFLHVPIPQGLLRLPCRAEQPNKSRLSVPAGKWLLGSTNDGFAFDNELAQHEVALSAFEIDSRVVTWADYLPFIKATHREMPRHVGASTLNPSDAAVHINWFDAKAWCDWAGRRLPTEAEWECAAMSNANFTWGEVWEWTDSTFQPYPNFIAHAYKDYSEPWFGTRKVLRGGSMATHARMVHPKYRNFFTPERTDIYAGFRSCKI